MANRQHRDMRFRRVFGCVGQVLSGGGIVLHAGLHCEDSLGFCSHPTAPAGTIRFAPIGRHQAVDSNRHERSASVFCLRNSSSSDHCFETGVLTVPVFLYEAVDLSGHKSGGVIDAGSRKAAIQQLTKRRLTPIALHEKTVQNGMVRSGIPRAELAAFYEKMSEMLKAGMPLAQSLKLTGEISGHAGFSEIVRRMHAEVIDGRNMADCMLSFRGVFDAVDIAIVRAGLEGAFLADALKELAQMSRRQQQLRGQILGALSYPGFLIVASTIMFFVLAILFVPRFAPMFSGLRERGELPMITEVVLGGSLLLRESLPQLAGLSFALIAAFLVACRNPVFLRKTKLVLLGLPGVKSLFLQVSLCRLSRLLSTLLNNGITLDRSLSLCSGATGSPALDDVILECSRQVRQGASFAKVLRPVSFIPREYRELAWVGEKTNALADVLSGASEVMEQQLKSRLDALLRLLEPVMLVVMGSVVAMFVFALVLPILRSSSLVG